MASSYLSKGSKGDEVKSLQGLLNAQGYKLEEDGVYGGLTEAAVRDYQTKSGLKVDGFAGQQTLSSLQKQSAPAPTPAAAPAAATGGGQAGLNPDEIAARLAELASTYANPAAQTTTAQAPYNIDPLKRQLNEYLAATNGQSGAAIDYATQQSVNELNRALEDAQPMYKTQRDQIALDEAQALDRSALYSELRGDQGGIGQEQYNEIQRTAALNRRAVATEQTKLATDTARQVADLRARGEFEKADAVLEMTQNYLSQLISLEQWAAEYNMSVDEFNAQLAQWQKEYETAVTQWGVQMTGRMPDGTPTYAAQQDALNKQSNIAMALLEAGIMPTPDQLTSLGMDAGQAQQYVTAQRLANAPKSSGGGSKAAESEYTSADLSWAKDVVTSWEAGETDRYSSKEYREALKIISASEAANPAPQLSEKGQSYLKALESGTKYTPEQKEMFLAQAVSSGRITPDDFILAMEGYGLDASKYMAE